MVPLVLLLTAMGFTGFGVYLAVLKSRERVAMWQELAREAGLTNLSWDAPFLMAAWLEGWAGSRRVRFADHTRDKVTYTRITAEGDSGLTLRLESLDTRIQKALGAREVEIGDESFDRAIFVHGAPEMARAVLDAETRREVRLLLEGASFGADVFIRDGDVMADDRSELPSALRTVLDAVLAAARRLDRPTSLPHRIAQNLAGEPDWKVRLRNVLLLASTYPNMPVSREAFERACQDEHPEVQLRAALALWGEKGRAALLEIASREWADDSHAARAVAALGPGNLPLERVLAVLGHALRTRRVATAEACLEVLGGIGGAQVVEPLATVLSIETGDLALAAARALGASRASGAETVLLPALKHPSDELRVAAAKALGRVGSAAAVLALKEAAERGPLPKARRAARQAIAEIQSRLTGASPGQLSLAEGEAGQLSLADEDPRGRVSMVPAAHGPEGAGSEAK